MASPFKDQTITWFQQGEDVERLRATPEVEPLPGTEERRTARWMLLAATVALVGASVLCVVRYAAPSPPAAVTAPAASSL